MKLYRMYFTLVVFIFSSVVFAASPDERKDKLVRSPRIKESKRVEVKSTGEKSVKPVVEIRKEEASHGLKNERKDKDQVIVRELSRQAHEEKKAGAVKAGVYKEKQGVLPKSGLIKRDGQKSIKKDIKRNKTNPR